MTDKRLAAIMGMMERDNDAEALNAMRHATRLLKARGMSWTQVAEMITGRALGDMMAPDGLQRPAGGPRGASADSQWEDIAEILRKAAEAAAASGPFRPRKPRPPPTRKTISGESVPASVIGIMTLIRSDDWNGRPFINVMITDYRKDRVYSPLTIFDPAIIQRAQAIFAASETRYVTATVRQPRTPGHGHNPVITVLEVGAPQQP